MKRRSFLSAVAGFLASPLAMLTGKTLPVESVTVTMCATDPANPSYQCWVEILPNGQYRAIDDILNSQGRLVKRGARP